MGKFVEGDIVVVPFPFSDLSSSKRRPALICVSLEGNDLILCQITSKNIRDNRAIAIDVNDIENGTLNETSNARPNKLFTADESIVVYKVGSLSEKKFRIIISTIIDMFKQK